jgi:DNA-binding CsgD family transcriptional regulator
METASLPVAPLHWQDYWREHPTSGKDEELAALLKKYFDPSLIFCSGQYFFYVTGDGNELIVKYIEGNFEQLTGYDKQPYIGQSILEFHRLMILAEDSPVLMSFSQRCFDFLSNIPIDKQSQVKCSFYYNILHKSGRLIPVIQQDSIHINPEGIPEYIFSFITDISHLKAKNELMFSILVIDNEGNQQFKSFPYQPPNLPIKEEAILTVRERQIINLLAEGMTSKQIALDLGIAFHTVNTHRQNMLAKTGCKSSAELVKYALDHALI